jgi:hypothetical protein
MKLNLNAFLKNALPYGLILGGLFVVFSLLVYIAGINMFSIWFSILNFLILIAFTATMAILGTNNLRVKLFTDRKINYLQALLSCFIILFIGFFIQVLYNYVFTHWIDPEFTKHSIEKVSEMLQGYNLPQDKIDEQLVKAEQNQGLGHQIIYSLGACIVLSLIMALIVRKKDKESQIIY